MRMLELANNPLRLAIWFEIFSNPGITNEDAVPAPVSLKKLRRLIDI